MAGLQSIKHLFAVPEDPELVLAQVHAMSRQVPMMYIMVLVNAVILASTHRGIAPDLLTLYIPGALSAACLIRIASWWRGRDARHTVEHARRALRHMMAVLPFLALGFGAWTIFLLPYGEPFQKSQVVFFCSITTIGCMFCLMHVRAAALTVGALTLAPFTVAMLLTGSVELAAIAINLIVVVGAMLIVLLGNYRDFAALVASRSAILNRQSETQRLSDENDRLANIDSLTDLPNRRRFDRQLAQTLQLADDQEAALAVACIDIDGFKAINATFGRITGDAVLAETARRILRLCPPGAVIARLSADNFAMIIPGPVTEAGLYSLGSALCKAMDSPFALPGAIIHLSASVGLAASTCGDTAALIYDRADYVTSLAKRESRGSAVVFSQSHQHRLGKERMLEHELHTADLDAEIYILFQPQVDIALGRTTGYEVLARWRSPVLGEVSPVEFIPLAERIGVISRVTQVVLRQALAASAKLPRNIRLSVNLSAHDVGSTNNLATIVALLKSSGVPSRVDLEITETALMRDLTQANASLLALLALGARIALDDFGTGFSSLTHVQKLPLDRIKVDRSFVAEVCNDPTSRAIIKTTIELCRNLGISCVFEGIETNEQLNALTALGGTIMQGYLFGRPADEAAMHAQLAQELADREADTRLALGAAG